MLAKQNRLTKQKDFEKIFKQARSFYSKRLGVKAQVNQSALNRFGIIISTKISKKATERNRLKRQIRQAARELNKELKPGFDLVIMALPGFINQEYVIVKEEMEKIFLKLRLFK